ncbi:MAG TPA: hypothetical protein VLB76_22305 [Thermoanaerobaculia bacterium]|nr:hypothetical protein [Thermoanaerobaculia bacterium]
MKNCFVCMPLIDDLRAVYYDAIFPEVRDAFGSQCQCAKADDQRRPGMVTEKIVHSLLNADLVIAVVADPREGNFINPNVMYEVGIAHSFRKPTLLVADNSNGLPFDLRAVETIQLDFSRFYDESQSAAFLLDLRRALRLSLKAPELQDGSDRRRIPRNPITTQLSGTQVFVEDLPWLWGYADVLMREREAYSIWEITRDLFWGAEPLFFASIKAAIRDERKHYFMVPEDEGIRMKMVSIRNQLIHDQVTESEIDRLLHFVEIDPKHFLLWPISIVLYDADLVTSRGGIICEPMTSEVGHDQIDSHFRDKFIEHVRAGGGLSTFNVDLDWIKKREEATFDIALDSRVVNSLATSFAKIWNERILEDARKMTDEQEQSALLKNWTIRFGGKL